MCTQYTDAPTVGYLTIKLQNSTWYKCLNLSLTGSHTYISTYVRLYRRTYIRTHICTYPRTENRKTICPRHHPLRGHKKYTGFLDCALTGVCAVIRSNTVSLYIQNGSVYKSNFEIFKPKYFFFIISANTHQNEWFNTVFYLKYHLYQCCLSL